MELKLILTALTITGGCALEEEPWDSEDVMLLGTEITEITEIT
ncbi:hypothetical protein [Enhygromyxa salina]|uniref:Uncharacterized protein n=1 Tax=Enhygromyxa salina TaxID=215803 RepID=A0A2S9YMR9_9BACT|nr:hypothetical protein [Enhygromyxa salina]PRQ06387.1 hypothetical protein ENSA7_39330 [Enhygromyxa salina]